MTGEVLATNTSAYWLERLDAEGVPSAPVLSRESDYSPSDTGK